MPDPVAGSSDGAPLREALLDQLEYLASEAEAIRTVIARVPEPLLEMRPVPDVPSVKELYAVLLRLDESAHLPFVEALRSGDDATLLRPTQERLLTGESWNERSIDEILTRLAFARRSLTEAMRALAPDSWLRTGTSEEETIDVYAFAYDVVQHDVTVLRAVGERFFEAQPPGPSP